MKIIILTIICLLTTFLYIVGLTKNKKDLKVWETTPGGPYTIIITDEGIACEHPQRKREYIRWDQVNEIRLVTTDEGPFLPDMWYLFIGESGGCSVPSEAKDFDLLWDELEKRFQGFNYEAILEAGTNNNQKTLWHK